MTALGKPLDLYEAIDRLKAEIIELKALIMELKEQNAWLKKQVFGPKSEKIVDHADQLEFPGLDLLQEEEIPEESIVKEHTRKKRTATEKDKLVYPDDLPIEQILLDISEDQKICPLTGEPLKKIGEEITKKLAIKPASYFIKEFIKPKYASPSRPELGVISREMPTGIFQKSKADESLLAHIVTMKFADHLPLYRIQEIMQRDKIMVSRQTLSYWVIKIGEALIPLYDLMEHRVLKSSSIYVDESPVKVLVPGKKKAHEGYMWIYVGGGEGMIPPYLLFDFFMNRNHANVIDKLENYQGLLHSDKYGAYTTLAKQKGIISCPCWAHIRRYFVEAQSGDQKFKAYVLRNIRYLYMFEKIAKKRSPEERLKIRKEKEEPIIDDLIEQVKKKLIEGKALPKSKYMKALKYFAGLTPYMKNYLNHEEASIDNNLAERSLRPLTIGRKNWLFVGSEKGGKATATLLSLIQTCRHLKINPREYIEDIMRRIMDQPMSRLSELLPDEWAMAQQKPDTS